MIRLHLMGNSLVLKGLVCTRQIAWQLDTF